MSCFCCKPANPQWSIRSNVSVPLTLCILMLVCPTFQWCSGHLNPIVCGCSQVEVVPVKMSHSNNHNSGRTQCEACLAADKIYWETHWTSTLLFFFLFFSRPLSRFGICFSDACGSLGDVSDLSPRQGAVSGQTAHQGEWQVLGQELRIHFYAPRWKVAHCSFNTKTFN